MKRPCSENKKSVYRLGENIYKISDLVEDLYPERYNCVPVREAKITKTKPKKNNKCHVLARMQSNRNSHVFLLRMQNSRPASESSLATSYKVKYVFVIQPNSLASREFTQVNWKPYLHRNCIFH